MARELLARLLAQHAFNPTPSEDRIGRYHVPFDVLLDGHGYETALADAVARGERVALIGESGSGKSSLTAHLFRQFGVAGTAALRVPVALEEVDVGTSARAFCAHLVRVVRRHVHDSAATRAEQSRVDQAADEAFALNQGSGPVTATVSAGPSWLRGEVEHELRGATDGVPTSADEVIEQADLVTRIIADRGLRPVLVLDDTDHWLRRPGLPDPDAVIAGFLGEVIRVMAERLPTASAVVAIHRSYLTHPAWEIARGFLETPVELPVALGPASVAKIVEQRAYLAAELADRPPSAEFIDPSALETLHANYVGGDNSLRTLMANLHKALTKACDGGADVIGVSHVDQAID